MVFENLFYKCMLKKRYIFFLTILYAVISIIIARLVFGSSSGIVSVAFLSFLLIPSIRKILSSEKESEEKQKTFTLRNLWETNKSIIIIYSLIFLGVFITYLFFSFLLPQFGINVFNIFQEQLFLDPALRGKASFHTGTFWSILSNNWVVLLVCFLLGIISGDGAIFFVSWNASAWGTIFGYRALTAGVVTGESPWLFLGLLIGMVIWHTLIEGLAYILAAISGSTISKDVISKASQIKKFYAYFIVGGLLTFFLIKLLRFESSFMNFTIGAIIFLSWVYFMKMIFQEKKYELVFKYNYYLLLVAVLIFVLGVVVETYVLSSSTILQNIYVKVALG